MLSDGEHENPFGTVKDLGTADQIRVELSFVSASDVELSDFHASLAAGRAAVTPTVSGTPDEDGHGAQAELSRRDRDGNQLPPGRYFLQLAGGS